jgi:hypothetical protein
MLNVIVKCSTVQPAPLRGMKIRIHGRHNFFSTLSDMDRLTARPKVHETLKAEGRHRIRPGGRFDEKLHALASSGGVATSMCGRLRISSSTGTRRMPVAFSIRLSCCIWLQATRLRRIGPNGSSSRRGDQPFSCSTRALSWHAGTCRCHGNNGFFGDRAQPAAGRAGDGSLP